MRALGLLITAVLALGASDVAQAHPLAPSVLSFEQNADATVTMRWRAPVKRPTGQSLRPRIPESCKPLGPAAIQRTDDEIAVVETVELRCEPPDMLGTVIEVDGFADSSINVVLRLVRDDGRH